MIASLIIIGCGLVWLMVETDFMRIRLQAYGSADKTLLLTTCKPVLLLPAPKPIDYTQPYWWQSPEAKQDHIMLCQDYKCKYHTKCKKSERWAAWKLPAKTIKAWNSTLSLGESCNIKRAGFLKDIAREQTRKHTFKVADIQMSIIETVPVDPNYRRSWRNNEATEYKTIYHDCLVSVEWLKAHEHDEYPESTIDIVRADGMEFHVNGNYKPGIIKGFIKGKQLSMVDRQPIPKPEPETVEEIEPVKETVSVY